MVAQRLVDPEYDEKLQLPQIREMLEGITDALSAVFGKQFASENAEPREIDRMAKPISTLVARKPQLQNFLKKYLAPIVLGGAVFAYCVPRLTGVKKASVKVPSSPAELTVVRRDVNARETIPPVEHGGSPAEAAAPPSPEKLEPTQARAMAEHADNTIDALRAHVSALG